MYRTFLSWRYLLRRRTNLIGIVGIFVAVAALILILSIMTGFLEQSRRTLRGTLSDLVITPHKLTRGDGRAVPGDPGPLLDALRAHPGVLAAAAHQSWFGVIWHEEGRSERIWQNPQASQYVGIKLVGIDLEDEIAATDFADALRRAPLYGAHVADPRDPFAPPPGYVPKGRPRPSVVLGDQLFGIHGLRRGDEIELLTAIPHSETGEWSTSNRQFVVAGTFRSGENEMDIERIYFEREELGDFLGDPGGFSEVLVRLEDYEADGERIRDELRVELDRQGLILGHDPSGEVRTWEEFRRVLLGAIENERVLMAIMLSLVLIVAGFTIFAILSMMVSEKRRDIGILSALGATRAGVTSVFLLIAFWDALLGVSLGALVGIWMALRIDPIERWLSETFDVEIFNRDVYLFDHIPSEVEPLPVLVIVSGAFLCALLCALYPALKAARLDPLDALRYE